jgi:hypothetical protein
MYIRWKERKNEATGERRGKGTKKKYQQVQRTEECKVDGGGGGWKKKETRSFGQTPYLLGTGRRWAVQWTGEEMKGR